MINIKNILCPIDYSVYSEMALKYAIEFAEKYLAKLYLIHVLDIRIYDINDPDLYNVTIVDAEMINKLRERLLKCVNEDTKGRISVEAVIIQGIPFAEIIKASKEYKIDLIVIGTHGRTGLSHAIMGSVAEKVVRKAPCPVLTIRHPEHDFIMP
ncbi:MAG: universal stress protein [Candidatus Brocadia sp. AMX2]|uniref:Universal stress protein n=1 Tax=Candidatus Brocadia sinica JPN1 TaxID=1197129 RepID=A0ABQ0JVV2_9BACT|nr:MULTISPECIES: universal stress protein [Brocadia]KXK30184.1 MAG: putative universal stress protein [Candidatus Brocadia sinica]MBC6930746.1 universal stress protein [Candidatus Brocadia sp.]MBL1167714.1 universal stress protein [Candidatus Brocadia sp. AMX1]NOG41327.1 universal stress protein [Planctomycetota bacterium]KAA0245613.1 MAG: universal stress protein [Candidatus Brocadia sp. AMX2]